MDRIESSSPVAGAHAPDVSAAGDRGVSVVVPVYNSAPMLPELVRRLKAVMAAEARPFEIVLVEDGSRDESWKTIVSIGAVEPEVRGLRHSRNYGQHNALLSGIRSARFPVIVTLDDDLQNPPESIPMLLSRLDDRIDLVYGSAIVGSHGKMRDFASTVLKWSLATVIGAEQARHASAFRAFRTHLRMAFAEFSGPRVSIDVLLSWGARGVGHVPVPLHRRTQGRSGYSLGRLFSLAVDMITGFSVVPLRLASIVGLGLSIFGALLLVYVLGRYLIDGGSVPGFPFLASVISIFSGAQMLCLGIIGEYLGRQHLRSLGQPTAVVSERSSPPSERPGVDP